MLSQWPIRNKLRFGIGLLLVIVATLSFSGFNGVYAYRELVRRHSSRAHELPLAKEISKHISNLRVLLGEVRATESATAAETGPAAQPQLDDEFRLALAGVRRAIARYQKQLFDEPAEEDRIRENPDEWQNISQMTALVSRLDAQAARTVGTRDPALLASIAAQLDQLQSLSWELPSYLHQRFLDEKGEVQLQYRALIVLTWISTVLAGVLLALFIRLFYAWVFRPLGVLVAGSRRVAAGEFGYRIALDSRDEMAELAEAMNDMTARFESIRDDLDRQVRERTKQVVRSEQLASVGFLAAGVAHEINNPLASIALCAESLESRIDEALSPEHAADSGGDREVIHNYLRMIQTEAFRCKGITEKLLDFSRLGDVPRHAADLGELVQGVIDMVGHLGRYHDKQIAFERGGLVMAPVNAQEIKQVVLNLITNALDSLSPGGSLQIDLTTAAGIAELTFADNGCGMTDEVLTHLFEPFFTRRRNGQGTGLGLSIAYRIVADHGGQIDAHSDGPGTGSRFKVTLPLAEPPADQRIAAEKQKESRHRYQAA